MRHAGLALLLLALPASADEVPLQLGVTVLLKVLTYEASFDTRGSGDFLVLVPFSGDKRAPADAAVEALAPLAHSKLRTRTLTFMVVKANELQATVMARKPAAILLLPDADDILLAETRRLGREARVYTLGLGEQAVQTSVTLGVTVKDSKPQVIINVPQARAEGCEFPQSILKLAKLVR